jgi:flagellar M-ring protein FliF
MLLALGVMLTLTLGGLAMWWATRPEYQVLFSDLRPTDVATFAAELDRRKVRYRIAEDERTLLVTGEDARALRLKLMSQDLPLHGSVGFELFNNSSFGLTEFAQKVNYQRALQGELARTITSLAEIESARVHLSMPDSTLFRRAGNRPKASVALTMRSGAELEPATVRGIQRLVAASVLELEVSDVTVLDARGVALARAGASSLVSDPKLEAKIDVEQYYARKVQDVVESLLGPQSASVAVDAQINHDQVRVTQETSSARGTRRPAQAVSEPGEQPGPPMLATVPEANSRRVEQIVAETGGLRRLTVGLQLNVALEPAKLERLKTHVAAAVGLVPARGDVISVFVRNADVAPPAAPEPQAVPRERAAAPLREPAEIAPRRASAGDSVPWLLAAGIVAATIALMLVRRLKVRRNAAPEFSAEQQRQLAQRLKVLLARDITQVPHGLDTR